MGKLDPNIFEPETIESFAHVDAMRSVPYVTKRLEILALRKAMEEFSKGETEYTHSWTRKQIIIKKDSIRHSFRIADGHNVYTVSMQIKTRMGENWGYAVYVVPSFDEPVRATSRRLDFDAA